MASRWGSRSRTASRSAPCWWVQMPREEKGEPQFSNSGASSGAGHRAEIRAILPSRGMSPLETFCRNYEKSDITGSYPLVEYRACPGLRGMCQFTSRAHVNPLSISHRIAFMPTAQNSGQPLSIERLSCISSLPHIGASSPYSHRIPSAGTS